MGLVAAGAGIALVPSSVRRLGREDIECRVLDEPEIARPSCEAGHDRAEAPSDFIPVPAARHHLSNPATSEAIA
jgi:DNA-binding transcriptional LysR family regulator